MTPTQTNIRRFALLLLALMPMVGGLAVADHGHDHHSGYWGPHYGSPLYYPRIGLEVSVLPVQPFVVPYAGVSYYFSTGIWYRPWGPRFVVVAPPIGVSVPLLPPSYVVRSYGSTTYYIANDVYYVANPSGPGYLVTAPPDLPAAGARPSAAQASDRLYIYPRKGQTKERQDDDRFTCHEWSVGETGFDPTRPQGGSEAQSRGTTRADYRRAMEACLDGRGYTVR
ncbi:hypothetical protein GCM10025771_35720 [Niveibacterium umoris]|uniref:Uncharacterized protein n=1 Tax=Niveibacterium umoris TaxID=1193620 RepID=A0A840BCH4_9RHOO|nr:DUF6515 family protein [Niveibacterium umoris]MBB4011231.1 hypothetical protein [Niveibacterium umoris]